MCSLSEKRISGCPLTGQISSIPAMVPALRTKKKWTGPVAPGPASKALRKSQSACQTPKKQRLYAQLNQAKLDPHSMPQQGVPGVSKR